jgi:hypothetical protein
VFLKNALIGTAEVKTHDYPDSLLMASLDDPTQVAGLHVGIEVVEIQLAFVKSHDPARVDDEGIGRKGAQILDDAVGVQIGGFIGWQVHLDEAQVVAFPPFGLVSGEDWFLRQKAGKTQEIIEGQAELVHVVWLMLFVCRLGSWQVNNSHCAEEQLRYLLFSPLRRFELRFNFAKSDRMGKRMKRIERIETDFLFRLRRIKTSRRRVKVRSNPFNPFHPFSILSLYAEGVKARSAQNVLSVVVVVK